MSKTISFVLAVALFLSFFSGCQKNTVAETPNEETPNDLPSSDSFVVDSPIADFNYDERGSDGIVIIKYTGDDEHVVIPSTINNMPVTSIGPGAFRESVHLKSVVIPKSVTSIGEAVFTTCIELTSFIVKEGNQSYSSQDGVLYNGDKSQIVLFPTGKKDIYVIPDCVKSIREYAFYGCQNLERIAIPSGIESIDPRSFAACPGLVSISVDVDNKFYSSLNGALYNKSQTQLISVPGGKTGTIEIPDSVTEIGAYAFSSCKCIENIIIPDRVTSIGEWAFSKCSALKEITLPEGLKEISLSLFNGCTNLKKVVIPESVAKIDEMAFYKCMNLANLELPRGLLSIGSRAFFGCTSLSDIIIPENVETVGAVLFQECIHVNIYVKRESQPVGWNPTWNHLDFPVLWGYRGS